MKAYNAFDEYHVKHNLDGMEKLFAGYVNMRLDKYAILYAKFLKIPDVTVLS